MCALNAPRSLEGKVMVVTGGGRGIGRAAARELAPLGITCNAIAPRAFTRMSNLRDLPQEQLDEAIAVLWPEPALRKLAMRKMDPGCVAPLVCYLASDAARDINGQLFRVGRGAVERVEAERPARRLVRADRWTIAELNSAVPQVLLGE